MSVVGQASMSSVLDLDLDQAGDMQALPDPLVVLLVA